MEERPTFHESWYRAAELRPRLLSSVHVFRQHFRGQMWHVLENTANNQYSRLNPQAYGFVGLLNGTRSVAQAWRISNEQFGDEAPTQGEVIHILGQLYRTNLLYVNLPTDGEALFQRYKKRRTREIQSTFMNILYVRIPLFDPDWFLNIWTSVFGILFTWFGLLLWTGLIGTGLFYVISNIKELMAQSQYVLAPGNLVFLYLTFTLIKICHEFSHAFACKHFGKLNKHGGQVHTMGVMFLILFPLPYMDASSAWAFPNKWHRAIVGMAGVLLELALAAVAAIVWANTSTGTIHIIAYNVIFVASISTLLFNGNFLLRFDAYYVLADVLEIPNLAHRSKDYLYYLVKRYAWGIKQARNLAYTLGERLWFVSYGIASTCYRIFICVRILMFLNNRLPEQLFFVVPVLIFSALIGWIMVPVGKLLKYLVTGPELMRNRGRAMLSAVGFLALVFWSLGWIRMPDYCRIEGILEPNDLTTIYIETDGFVTDYLDSGSQVRSTDTRLIRATNPELQAQYKILGKQHARLVVQRRIAQTEEIAATQILDEQIQALDEQISRIETQLASLTLYAPQTGTWFSPTIDRSQDLFLVRGQAIGRIGDMNDLIIRATAPQTLAALLDNAEKEVHIRLRGYPHCLGTGTLYKIAPMGQDELPAEALAYQIGGNVAVRSNDPSGPKTAENIFEVRIKLNKKESLAIKAGQRIVARVQLTPKPLLHQWYRSARQLFQRRFYI
jgi:putative peptide zinc metalloprotease protein